MRSLKKQIAVLCVLMVLVLAALTLGGLQLFGKGKAKPSEWFKKADKPQTKQAEQVLMYSSAMRNAQYPYNVLTDIEYNPQEGSFRLSIYQNLWASGTNLASGEIGVYAELRTIDGTVIAYVKNHGISRTCSWTNSPVSGYIFDESNFHVTYSKPVIKCFGAHLEAGRTYELYVEVYRKYAPTSYDSSVRFETECYGEGSKTFETAAPVEFPPDPEKEGYTFAGWYYGESHEDNGENCTAYNGEPIYDDTAFHPHFAINVYTLTLNPDGGTLAGESSIPVEHFSHPELPTPTRTGCNFLGWKTEDGEFYNSAETAITGNLTLRAAWAVKKYTLTLDPNGGTLAGESSLTVEHFSHPELPCPIRTGYNFLGWQTADGATYDTEATEITGDLNLTAAWQIKTYTLTLDLSGGTLAGESSFTVEHFSHPELPCPIRTGYNFLGWQTADGETYDTEATEITGDLNLTAAWAIKRFTVTFYNEDGSVCKQTEVDYGTQFGYIASASGLEYYMLYSEDGEKVMRSNIVVGDVSVIAVKMTKSEKIGYFFVNHIWAFWLLIALIGGLIVALFVAILVAKRKV